MNRLRNIQTTLKDFGTAAILVLPILLGACGETRGDRALSGAGIGAAAGTVGTAIMGGNPVTGAILGGAAGAATGAITDPDDVNLGRPVWDR